MNKRVLISGCSGGGKSTLLSELATRGYLIIEEPGRRIVRQELMSDGDALPWTNLAAFARRAFGLALEDYAATSGHADWTFFDRGLIDAMAALQHATGEPLQEDLLTAYKYHRRVFLTPPWPEIFETDAERKHGFEDAVAEHERIAALLPRLGYEVVLLPKVHVAARADFLLACLDEPRCP